MFLRVVMIKKHCEKWAKTRKPGLHVHQGKIHKAEHPYKDWGSLTCT